jgi:hypothetical protein
VRPALRELFFVTTNVKSLLYQNADATSNMISRPTPALNVLKTLHQEMMRQSKTACAHHKIAKIRDIFN